MNLSKLARRLRREAVGSPKKAAVLALLAVVALYYWMPLVWGWIGKANGSGTAAVAAATPPAAATNTPPAQPAATSPTAAKPAGAAMTWQETLRAIEADPRTVPAALLGGRDPFVEEKPAVVAAQKTEEPKDKPPPAISPAALGLTLSGTLIGPKRRVARLNGKNYELGAILEVVKDGHAYAFTLTEIEPRSVVLTHNGQQHELRVKETAGSRIEMTQAETLGTP